MKKFRNRLAALERVRALRRQAARVDLARAAADLREHEIVVERSLAELERSESAHGDLVRTGSVAPLKQWSAWCAEQRERLGRAHDELAICARRFEAARSGYRVASSGVRVLEQVRERRHRTWRVEWEREETRFLSESYLQRRIRSGRSGEEGS